MFETPSETIALFLLCSPIVEMRFCSLSMCQARNTKQPQPRRAEAEAEETDSDVNLNVSAVNKCHMYKLTEAFIWF